MPTNKQLISLIRIWSHTLIKAHFKYLMAGNHMTCHKEQDEAIADICRVKNDMLRVLDYHRTHGCLPVPRLEKPDANL